MLVELFSAPLSLSSVLPKDFLAPYPPFRQSLNWPSVYVAHNNQRCGMKL